jgi:HPt (histidine-containing phosphotransfer) domain-containing protein
VDLVGQLATLFLVDADSRVAAMRQGLVASDPMAVVESAHALRGASANIGATDLAWVCETLELSEGADEPENAGKLWSGVRSVAAELELVRSALAARSTAG